MYNTNKVKVGELKYPIKIIKSSKSGEIDENGLTIESEPVVINRKAKVSNSSYKKMEILQAEGITGFNSLDFIFRYCDIDKVKDYIEYKNKKYDIKSAIDLYNDGTFILATGVTVDG